LREQLALKAIVAAGLLTGGSRVYDSRMDGSQAEGIEFEHIEFIDNGPMIELITEKRKGILPMLDEEIKTPGGSDKNFLIKLAEQQAGDSSQHGGDSLQGVTHCCTVTHHCAVVTHH
jgi:hypothetical protein